MKSMQRALACVTTVSLFGIMIAAPAHAVLDPADIIAIWLFDEGEGDTANDASGNPHDMDGRLPGNRHDSEALRPRWVDGKFGKALKCEGEGSVIVVPNFINDERLGPDEDDADAGNLLDETEITITAWVQRNDEIGTAAQKDLFSFQPGGPWENRILVHFPWDDGEGEFVLWQYGKPEPRNHWKFPANAGKMNHYAFTGKGDVTVIYQNGRFVHHARGSEAPFIRTDAHGPWHICGRFGASAQVTVDEIAVFSRVLTHDEIATIMREGLEVAAASALGVVPAEKISTIWGVIKTTN